MADKPLFILDTDARWRLAYDANQWVLQQRRGKARVSHIEGRSIARSGYEAVYSPGEMRLVVDTPDLPTLRQRATDLVRERGLRARIARISRYKAWRDPGDLKRELLDLWTEERNTLAKEVMQDIEVQRRKAKGGLHR